MVGVTPTRAPGQVDRRTPDPARPLPIRPLDPQQTGLRRWLGPTEVKVLTVMWERDPACTRWVRVKPVWWTIVRDLEHEVGYTTIMTTMSRMAADGFLDRRWCGVGGGGVYVYQPRETRACFVARNTAIAVAALAAHDGEE